VEIAIRDPEYVVATIGSVFLSIWWTTPTARQLEAVRQYRDRFLAKPPGKFFVFTILRANRPKALPPEARQLAEVMKKEVIERCLGEANVIESTGLTMTMARMFLSAINLVLRNKYPSQIFSSSEEALQWTAPLVGVDPDVLRASIAEAIRARPAG
jgi:hypothetical protein